LACVYLRSAAHPCHVPGTAHSRAWFDGEGLCAQHEGILRGRFYNDVWERAVARDPNRPHSALLEDYLKLYALMMDKAKCLALMSELNNEMVSGAAAGSELSAGDARFVKRRGRRPPGYARLSRVLEYYEGLCWFPTTHRLYTGNLTSENYVGSIALGYMPKDAGAGAQHGEYSHRLQWHLIMRVVTEGFTQPIGAQWAHSPLELFTRLGEPWAMGKKGLWGVIFDDQNGLRYNNPAVLNMDLTGSFSYHGMVGEQRAADWRLNTEMLHANAKRRADKRLKVARRAQTLYDRFHRRHDRSGLTDVEIEINVVALVERWRKMGKPPSGQVTPILRDDDGTRGDVAAKNVVLNKLGREVWFQLAQRARPGGYREDETEPNALLADGDRLMTAEAVRQRVAESRQRFNPSYAYQANLGAYPKPRAPGAEPDELEGRHDLSEFEFTF
jgi:hypothetical protein